MKRPTEKKSGIEQPALTQEKPRHWVDLVHGPATAWAVFAISLIITLIAWSISNNYADQRAEERFEFQIDEAQDAIYKRFINYEQVLRGALGLFKASTSVESDEWHNYIATLGIDQFFPGTLGVGYSLWLKPDQLEAHINKIRQQGFPQFTVRPEGERDEYSSIIFLEPFNERNQRAFGYDMYSEPVRREAMMRARESGQTALSGKVTLVQEASSGAQAGILIYVPHYRQNAQTINERRDALIGFVYSALRVGDLMQGILGVGLPELDFTIFDGDTVSTENILYQTDAPSTSTQPGYQPRFSREKHLAIGGRTWTINYRTNAAFEEITSSHQPALVATGGVIIDFLLFNIILSLSRLRKRAQALADERMKKLGERERQFQAITENAYDGIITLDEQRKITYLNPSARLLFGYGTDEVQGISIFSLFPANQTSMIENALAQQSSDAPGKKIKLLETEGIDKNNEAFPLEFSLACWRVDGRIFYTVIVRDITERKKIERIKNEFISTVSHELRTPLTAISGSLKLIECGVTGDISEKTMGLIKNANKNTVRLATLVNDLLDSEKMSFGNMRYEMNTHEISDLVEKALEINQVVASQSNITLTFSEKTSVNACVDADRFVQVMTNLIANAIKFSTSGGSIEVSMKIIGDEVRVAVTDHGSGVPESFRAQMFHKFAQADSSDTRKHGGTGLGLSIAKFIVEKFDGRIDYTSTPDVETSFFFFIPIAKNIQTS